MKTQITLFSSIVGFTLLVAGLTACNNNDADIHYAAIGASDTLGIGANPISEGYVFRIQDGLSDRGKETGLLNLGIPGAGIDEMREIEEPLADRENPDLITVFAGGNDLVGGKSVETFDSQLMGLLDDLRNDTEAFIVIATLPDVTKAPRFIDEPDVDVTTARVNAFNDVILRQAVAHNIPVADLREIDVGSEVTANDGFHPNGDGYEIIANEFLKIIVPHFFSGQAAQ
jgi:lysophospholipase L1-like esterase